MATTYLIYCGVSFRLRRNLHGYGWLIDGDGGFSGVYPGRVAAEVAAQRHAQQLAAQPREEAPQ